MKKEYKWGFIDRDGNMVIAARFDDAGSFHEERAVVKVEWARGYIDAAGNYIVEPRFQYAGPFADGRALVGLDGLWWYIDRDGNALTEPEGERPAETFLSPQVGAPSAEPEWSEGLAVMAKGKKYGYVDSEGKYVIKPAFIQAKPFSEGLAAVLVAL